VKYLYSELALTLTDCRLSFSQCRPKCAHTEKNVIIDHGRLTTTKAQSSQTHHSIYRVLYFIIQSLCTHDGQL